MKDGPGESVYIYGPDLLGGLHMLMKMLMVV